jgi:hypothetical protein
VAINSTRIAAADPVHDEAERWPPAGVGDIVVVVLPEVLEPVAGEAERRRGLDETERDSPQHGRA